MRITPLVSRQSFNQGEDIARMPAQNEGDRAGNVNNTPAAESPPDPTFGFLTFGIVATGAGSELPVPTAAATTTPVAAAPVTNSARPAPTDRSPAPAGKGGESADSSALVITLIDGDIKKPASFISQLKKYHLDISHDGEFYIGAVRLKASGEDSVVSDLIEATPCLQMPRLAGICQFYGTENPVAIPAVKFRSRQNSREEPDFSMILSPIPGDLDTTKNYTIEVVWSNVADPMEQYFRHGNASNPYDNAPIAFRVASAGAADPGLPSPTSTLGPSASGTNTNTASGISSTADPTAAPNFGSGGGGGLSPGAKAGISVGAVLGVLAILALIFLCLHRRKSKRVTAGGYYGDAPGSSNDLREKEAGVGIAAIPLSASQSPASERNSHVAGDSASLGRGHSARVVDGATMERGDGVGRHATTGHTAPVAAAAAAAPVSRKPVHRNVSDEEPGTQRDGAISSQSQGLSDEERARWEEEERRLDEDIAEAERRQLA